MRTKPMRKKPRPKNSGRPKKKRAGHAAGAGNIEKSHERYMTLARAAEAAGDAARIENLYQHAEHYFRLMRERAVPEQTI